MSIENELITLVRVKRGQNSDLSIPENTPFENYIEYMKWYGETPPRGTTFDFIADRYALNGIPIALGDGSIFERDSEAQFEEGGDIIVVGLNEPRVTSLGLLIQSASGDRSAETMKVKVSEGVELDGDWDEGVDYEIVGGEAVFTGNGHIRLIEIKGESSGGPVAIPDAATNISVSPDGTNISGRGEVAAGVIVRDSLGSILAEGIVAVTGNFGVFIDPPLVGGEIVTVTLTNSAGSSAPATVKAPTASAGDGEALTLLNFTTHTYEQGGVGKPLDELATYNRGSVATDWVGDILTDFAVNEPRISSAGLLIEPQLRNLFSYNTSVEGYSGTSRSTATAITDPQVGECIRLTAIADTDLSLLFVHPNGGPFSGDNLKTILVKKGVCRYISIKTPRARPGVTFDMQEEEFIYLRDDVTVSYNKIGEWFAISIADTLTATNQSAFALYAGNGLAGGGESVTTLKDEYVDIAYPLNAATSITSSSVIRTSAPSSTRGAGRLTLPHTSGNTYSGDWDEGVEYSVEGDEVVFEGIGHIRTIEVVGESTSYGLIYDEVADTYERIGQSNYTEVQSLMRMCVLNGDGSVNYYLDQEDISKKADGSPSDLTGGDGDVMVEIPKFYYNMATDGNLKKAEISLLPTSGLVLHPTFMKAGVEVDHRYMRAYKARSQDGVLRSISGVVTTRNITRGEYRDLVTAKGPGWHLVDWKLRFALQLLVLIEAGTFRADTVFGGGKNSGLNTRATGVGNDWAGGSTANGDTTETVKYRGIEDIWGLTYEFVEGMTIVDRAVYLCDYYTKYTSSSPDENYYDIGISVPTTSGVYCKEMEFSMHGFFPISGGGSATTYVGDGYYTAPGIVFPSQGGSSGTVSGGGGEFGGMWCMVFNSTSNRAGTHIGAGICF